MVAKNLPNTNDDAPLYLHQLTVQNFMGLEMLTINADGRHVVIEGPNGSGKSSAANAFYQSLCGTQGKRGEVVEPIHKGAEEAVITSNLGEFTVARYFDSAGTRIVVKAKDGHTIRRPAELLDRVRQAYSLDPMAWLELRKQEQIDEIMRLCRLEPPVAKVREITEEDWPAQHNERADQYLLRLIADEKSNVPLGEIYMRRRDAGRAVETKRAALTEQHQALADMGGPVQDAERKSSGDQAGELQALNAKLDERRKASSALNDAEQKLKVNTAKLDEVRGQKSDVAKTIEDLRAKLAAAEATEKALADRIANAETNVMPAIRDMVDKAKAALDAIPDPTPRIEQITTALKDMEAKAKGLVKRDYAAEQIEKLAAELKTAETEHNRRERQMEALRDLKTHLLDGIDLGVKGLSIGNGELLVNGVPLAKASTSEKLRVACGVGMLDRPKVRVIWVDDGERLDATHRQELLRIAGEHGFQVLMTTVADRDDLHLEFYDRKSPVMNETKPARVQTASPALLEV